MVDKKFNFDLQIPGYTIDVDSDASDLEATRKRIEETDWECEFDKQLKSVQRLLSHQDRYNMLAAITTRFIMANYASNPETKLIVLAFLELLQSILLMSKFDKESAPLDPNHINELLESCWSLFDAFSNKQLNIKGDKEDVLSGVARDVKAHTLYFRFPFDLDFCCSVVEKISIKFDRKFNGKYLMEERYKSLVELLNKHDARFREFIQHFVTIGNASTKEQVVSAMEFFLTRSENARREWSRWNVDALEFEKLQQLSTWTAWVSQEWIYTFTSEDLSELDRKTLMNLSMEFGDLAECEIEHFFLDNPVWKKPFILRNDGSYFTCQPQAAMTFPFEILERLIPENESVQRKFSQCKSEVLEDLVYETVVHALPSARVYRGVIWKSPENGKCYENDLVAILGNQIFIFEAKSGKIPNTAKRGARKSLKKSLEKLFVEPAKQSERLQNYLNDNPKECRLHEKSSGKQILLDLCKPKAVYRFSVTMEGLGSITSGRRYFEKLGLIGSGTPWAPSFTINELQTISRFLDSEVSFGHYLTRRYSIEKIMNFHGDERDLLSMYLTNGFCIDESTKGRIPYLFKNADTLAQQEKVPRSERANADVIGVNLPGFWKSLVKKIYIGDPQFERYKFDILFTLLNQSPQDLDFLQRRILNWRSGAGGKSKRDEYSKFSIDNRQFVFSVYLFDVRKVSSQFELKNACRQLAEKFCKDFCGISDCLVLRFNRRTNPITYDGIYFARFYNLSTPVAGPII